MKMNIRLGSALTAAAVFALLATPAVALPTVDPTAKTLENLQAAFNGESNANAKYSAFAKKADEEGYGKLGSLFRAAAAAEKVHADNHAVVIRKMGGEPKAEILTPVVATSSKNLEAAIAGETYERDTMYPEFISTAKAAGSRDALQTLNYAKTAEAEHAKFYQAALADLPSMKGAGQTYYVCAVCGMTTTNLNFKKCVSCFTPKEKYFAVA
jgi:rubrerythrin